MEIQLQFVLGLTIAKPNHRTKEIANKGKLQLAPKQFVLLALTTKHSLRKTKD